MATLRAPFLLSLCLLLLLLVADDATAGGPPCKKKHPPKPHRPKPCHPEPPVAKPPALPASAPPYPEAPLPPIPELPPKPPAVQIPTPPPGRPAYNLEPGPGCPVSIFKLGVCAPPLLGGILGDPLRSDCCSLLGMVGIHVEVCLCAAMDADVFGIGSVSIGKIEMIASICSTCGKEVPPDFSCP